MSIWRRGRTQHHPTTLPGEPSTADVVHQLQQASAALLDEAHRLDAANQTVTRHLTGEDRLGT